MTDIIVGVSRTLEDIGPLAKWNKKRLRWIITHNTPTYTRQHIIDLQMVLISSQRVVIVDNVQKLRTLVSFGFKESFDISQKLSGRIEQDTLTFQLYVNGQSFTELSKKQYGYQPPKLEINFSQPQPEEDTIFKPKNKLKSPPPTLSFIPNKPPVINEPNKQIKPTQNTNPMHNAYNKNIVIKQPQKLQSALKNTQDEVKRIMIEQKRRKKQMQAMQNQLNNS